MRDLIVFGEDFGGLPSSTQHLISRISKTRKVVWVNSIGLRQPKLNWHDSQRVINKLLGKTKAGYAPASPKQNSNLIEVNLKTIPAPASRFARHIAKEMMLRQLKPVLESNNIRSPILWSSLPTAADLCGHLDESAVVYYCGDDFESLAGVDHKVVGVHERKLMDKANLILAASEKIRGKFPACKTQLLPHGVDVKLFSEPAKRAHDLPSNGKPTAGFYGSLSNWLDYDMLEKVCLERSNWNFVFIGPNELDKCALPQLPNVYVLGPRPHHTLPSYSQHWDVSLLPFTPNEQIQACSPLKLMEYIAARTPIITTPFPALNGFKQHVNCVENAQQMIDMLPVALNQPILEKGLLDNHSWDSRSEFVSWLLELL